MSNFQKLTPAQFEAIGREFDAIRNRVRADLGERDANYIRGMVKRWPLSALTPQTLRQGTNDHTQPIVTPVVNYNWLSTPTDYGGRFNLDANVLNLNRLEGTGSHRLSVGTGWSLPLVDAIGDSFLLSTTVRGGRRPWIRTGRRLISGISAL